MLVKLSQRDRASRAYGKGCHSRQAVANCSVRLVLCLRSTPADLCACTVLYICDMTTEGQKQAAVLRCSAVALCLCCNSSACTALQVCGMHLGALRMSAVLLCRILALCLCCQLKRLRLCGNISVGPEEVALCLCSSLKRLQRAAGLWHAVCPAKKSACNALQGCDIMSVGPTKPNCAASSTTAPPPACRDSPCQHRCTGCGLSCSAGLKSPHCPAGLWHHICGRSGGHCPRELAPAASVPFAVGAHHPSCWTHDRCGLLIWCALLGWHLQAAACLVLTVQAAVVSLPSSR